jgi:hypothetical protein
MERIATELDDGFHLIDASFPVATKSGKLVKANTMRHIGGVTFHPTDAFLNSLVQQTVLYQLIDVAHVCHSEGYVG